MWFMQHLAGHLLQQTAVLDLAGERISRPKLVRLADTTRDKATSPRSRMAG